MRAGATTAPCIPIVTRGDAGAREPRVASLPDTSDMSARGPSPSTCSTKGTDTWLNLQFSGRDSIGLYLPKDLTDEETQQKHD